MTDSYDYLIKCLIIGDSGTGKSSLMVRFADEIFNSKYISTIGVDFKIKTIQYSNKNIKFQIWDTAGQERFRNITSSYYRGAHAIIVCYDITDKQTFNNIIKWLEEIEKYTNSKPLLILCGTKLDLEKYREITYEEGDNFAKSNNMLFFETSSKLNSNIYQIFEDIAKHITSIIKTITNDIYTQNELRTRKRNIPVKIQDTKKTNYCC
jgi:Ras-related protein Rab-1A